ncbi:tmk, partial [Acrasis kona]
GISAAEVDVPQEKQTEHSSKAAKEADKVRQAIQFYHNIHKRFTPTLIDEKEFGFNKCGVTFVWKTVIYGVIPKNNRFVYPPTSETLQKFYERLCKVGVQYIGTNDDYPATYQELWTEMYSLFSSFKKVEESETLVRETMYPTNGTFLFKLGSHILRPLNKSLIPDCLRKEYGYEMDFFDYFVSEMFVLLTRILLPFIPFCVLKMKLLINFLYILEPKTKSIYRKTKRYHNADPRASA